MVFAFARAAVVPAQSCSQRCAEILVQFEMVRTVRAAAKRLEFQFTSGPAGRSFATRCRSEVTKLAGLKREAATQRDERRVTVARPGCGAVRPTRVAQFSLLPAFWSLTRMSTDGRELPCSRSDSNGRFR